MILNTSTSFFLFLYFIHLIIAVFVRIIYRLKQDNSKITQILRILENGIYFCNILGLFIEGFIDFIIAAIYNLKMPLYNTNGEIFGNYFAYFSVVSTLGIIFPLSIMIIFINKKHLSEKKFKDSWSILYEGIKR